MSKLFLCLVATAIMFFTNILQAQDLTQQIRGKVTDALTGQALPGALVTVGDVTDPVAKGETNENGRFEIENVPLGRYEVIVSYEGYVTSSLPELLINASRSVELVFELIPGVQQMDEVVINSQLDPLTIDGISTRFVTPEQTLRFASTYFDVARLTTAYPGVSVYNDQANNIISRGISPNSIQWRLEGVEILNPNHLANAGTLGDRPTQSGGGVNILSTQMLANSKFVNSSMNTGYGNAMSGYYDMQFRKGNTEKAEFVAQASLIGIDLSAEGPFKKGSNSSYLVNYRYSFVGLLTSMGVDFGGESIAFQDLAFNISFEDTKTGNWKVFGMGGKSKNEFVTERDDSQWEKNKDQFDIFYQSKMGALGFTNQLPMGARSVLKTTLTYSGLENTRASYILDPTSDYASELTSNEESRKNMLSLNSNLAVKVWDNSFVKFGIQYSHMDFDLFYAYRNGLGRVMTPLQSKEKYDILQPFAEYNGAGGKFEYSVGLRYYMHSLNSFGGLEPRLNILMKTGAKSVLYGGYALVHQVQLPEVYFTDPANYLLEPSKNNQFQLGVKNQLGRGLLTLEGYYYALDNVPVEKDEQSDFSVLNMVDGVVEMPLDNSGEGRNMGIELSYDRKLERNLYYIISATAYSSEYKGSDNVWRNTRFNGKYGFNATGGKEFGNSKKSVFGINAQFTWLGGLWDTPINEALSEVAGETIYEKDQAFSSQLSDYQRVDIRISWTKNKPNYTRMLSLDIQNLLSIENDAYMMYDPFLKEVKLETQLGIIPVLSYRVEF